MEAGLGADFDVETDTCDWLVVDGGRGPVEAELITTTGLAAEETDEVKVRDGGDQSV